MLDNISISIKQHFWWSYMWLCIIKIKTPTLKLQEEVESCKSTYDALNSQLLEELPQFLGIGSDIYVMAIKEFISNRRLFVGRITQELLALMDVSISKYQNKVELRVKVDITKFATNNAMPYFNENNLIIISFHPFTSINIL